jgi:hypothetical protein
MIGRSRMNPLYAIVIAAGLIAGAVLVSSRADSQSALSGRYVGVGVADNGLAAWRIDTTTGDMQYCTLSSKKVVCIGQ